MDRHNGQVILRSLADLGAYASIFAPAHIPPEHTPPDTPDPLDCATPTTVCPCGPLAPDETETGPVVSTAVPLAAPDPADSLDDIDTLVTALTEAATTLRAIAEADAEARERASSARAVYRQTEEAVARLDALHGQAGHILTQAETLITSAFTAASRDRAAAVAHAARTVRAVVETRLTAVRERATALAADPDLGRLLAEERQAEEAAKRVADQQRQDERLRQDVTLVHTLLAEGDENEATRLLGALTKDHPSNPDIASLISTLDRRRQAVKAAAAETALRAARRLLRRSPAEAAALLGPLDVDGVPDPLARQVYGCWRDACRRFAPAGARHYSPSFGHGAVLTAADAGEVVVVAAIGLPDWTPGRRLSAGALRGLRPL